MLIEQLVINDVEALAYSVEPWEMRMAQLSPGRLDATMRATSVGGIFVSIERWSRKIAANGLTPPGYLVLAGPIADRGFNWCGVQTEYQRLAYAMDGREIDFVTWDDDYHWTLLVPVETLSAQLGEESRHGLASLPNSVMVEARFSNAIARIILDILDPATPHFPTLSPIALEQAAHQQLLAAIAKLLLSLEPLSPGAAPRSVRLRAYMKARALMEGANHPISIEQLARQMGVTRRCLELGFKEAIGVSPKQFSQRIRLNALRRELIQSEARSSSVTQAAENWGFTELGRTAGHYKEMFGELPSETLMSRAPRQQVRYLDLL